MLSFIGADVLVKLYDLVVKSQAGVLDLSCLFGHPWNGFFHFGSFLFRGLFLIIINLLFGRVEPYNLRRLWVLVQLDFLGGSGIGFLGLFPIAELFEGAHADGLLLWLLLIILRIEDLLLSVDWLDYWTYRYLLGLVFIYRIVKVVTGIWNHNIHRLSICLCDIVALIIFGVLLAEHQIHQSIILYQLTNI